MSVFNKQIVKITGSQNNETCLENKESRSYSPSTYLKIWISITLFSLAFMLAAFLFSSFVAFVDSFSIEKSLPHIKYNGFICSMVVIAISFLSGVSLILASALSPRDPH